MAKEIIQHRDLFGQELAIDDCVVYPISNIMHVGKVIKINPKMVKVQRVGNKGWRSEVNKYPSELVKVQGAEVTMYLLRASNGKSN